MSKSKNSKLSALDAERILMLAQNWASAACNFGARPYREWEDRMNAAEITLQDFLNTLSKD